MDDAERREQEEWMEAKELFLPCPDDIWVGVFEDVARVTTRGWDIWAGTFAAIAAWAGRRIEFQYYRSTMFGMAYVLCLSPTGSGKEGIVELAEALCESTLDEAPYATDHPQSGEGLFPLMSKVPTDLKMSVYPSRNVLLTCREWTKLLTIGGVKNSTLLPMLNELFHKRRHWDVSRSDRNLGGGKKFLGNPQLTVLGTTTPKFARLYVTDDMVAGGFLNRYLVLPGPIKPFDISVRNDALIYPAPSRTCGEIVKGLEKLLARPWGNGDVIKTAFESRALDIIEDWGRPLFNGQVSLGEKTARLHFYAYQIALLSAYARGAELVEEKDAVCAVLVAECSRKFTNFIWKEKIIQVPVTEAFHAELSEKIMERCRIALEEGDPYKYNAAKMRNSVQRQFHVPPRLKLIRSTVMDLVVSKELRLKPGDAEYFGMADAPNPDVNASIVADIEEHARKRELGH